MYPVDFIMPFFKDGYYSQPLLIVKEALVVNILYQTSLKVPAEEKREP